MVIFHSYVNVYQRVNPLTHGDFAAIYRGDIVVEPLIKSDLVVISCLFHGHFIVIMIEAMGGGRMVRNPPTNPGGSLAMFDYQVGYTGLFLQWHI